MYRMALLFLHSKGSCPVASVGFKHYSIIMSMPYVVYIFRKHLYNSEKTPYILICFMPSMASSRLTRLKISFSVHLRPLSELKTSHCVDAH